MNDSGAAARPTAAPVHVVVVDDEPMVCAFLRSILAATGQVVVDDVAYDGAAGVEAAVRMRPDVVLMDLRMPGVDGVTATAEIRSLPEPPAVVVMTTFDTDEHLLAALDAGASGFLLKTTPPDRLVPLVVAAAAGASVLSPAALRRLRERGAAAAAADPAGDPELDALAEREAQVLTLVAEGLSNADIADRLYLSEGTVKGHVSRLMTKLNCQNRTQLALRAARPGRG
ncbi:response regulator transcription factor [Actinoallomurus soli]|uniref:response regulator transcription factor n=1 Tax=Actinoallomurus soli TaxID=2952535 RepID=UPI002093BFFC|nr:response regulator transcription factor [Actinoallomurus soli]MCO5974108.1 response regulator transcription factor [Actinoallomurus soli]